MKEFRITKYNPKFRNEKGWYIRKDWTSISDVGRSFFGRKLTLGGYLRIEDAYVEAVRRFLLAANTVKLSVKNREFRDVVGSLPNTLKVEAMTKLSRIERKRSVSGDDIDWIVRLCLRECFWCRLEGVNGVYVYFGYDYYMYCGLIDEGFKMPQLPSGMYAELCDKVFLLG